MSKIKLLLDVVSDIRALADSLQAVCDAIVENEATEPVAPDTTKKKAETQKVDRPKKKATTLEEVRAILAVKSQAGLTAGVREIIQKYGATKLSEIEPKHYADMLKDAEGLTNE